GRLWTRAAAGGHEPGAGHGQAGVRQLENFFPRRPWNPATPPTVPDPTVRPSARRRDRPELPMKRSGSRRPNSTTERATGRCLVRIAGIGGTVFVTNGLVFGS